MQRMLVLFILFFFLIIPTVISATPLLYSVDGVVGNSQNSQIEQLYGHVLIENRTPPPENLFEPGQIYGAVYDEGEDWHLFYSFDIVSFTLYTDSHIWHGTSGQVQFEFGVDSTPSCDYRDFLMPGFSNGWIYNSPQFQENDGTNYNPYDIRSWMSLPPQISTSYFDIGDCADGLYGRMTLTRVAPIPEPTTMLLLFIGLVGVACSNLKRRKKNL